MKLHTKIDDGFLRREVRGIEISEEKKRFWAVLLDLLLVFDDVCRRHDIKYFLIGGSALGAVRHRGFIPWDDDVDVGLRREDYNKLLTIARDEFKAPYFFQCFRTESGYFRTHAQLRNSETTAIVKGEMCGGKAIHSFNQGVFIDVFILDDVPDDDEKYEVFAAKLLDLRNRIAKIEKKRVLARRAMSPRHPLSCITILKAKFFVMYEKFLGKDFLHEAVSKFDSLASCWNGRGMKRCANLSLYPVQKTKMRLPVEFFDEQDRVAFESFKFPIMQSAEEYLERKYGNWREHVVGGTIHGGLLVDLDNPYTKYL